MSIRPGQNAFQAPQCVQEACQSYPLQIINMTHIQQYQVSESFPDEPTLPALEQDISTTDTSVNNTNNTSINTTSNHHQIGAQAGDIDHELNIILGVNNKNNKNKKRQRTSAPNTPSNCTTTNSNPSPPKKRRKITMDITNDSPINNKNHNGYNCSNYDKNKPLNKPRNKRKKQNKRPQPKLQETITNDIDINDNGDWNELFSSVKQFSIKKNKKIKEKMDIITKQHNKEIAKYKKEIQKINIEHKRPRELIKNKMTNIQEKIDNNKNTRTMLQNIKQNETRLKHKNNELINKNNELNDNINVFKVENKSLSKSLDAGNQFIKQLLNKHKSLKTNIMACQSQRQNDITIIDQLKEKLKEKQQCNELKEVEQANKMLVEWNKSSRNTIQQLTFEIEKYKKMQETYQQITMDDMDGDAVDFDENIFDKKSVVDAMIWEENERGKILKREMNDICNEEENEILNLIELRDKNKFDTERKKTLGFKHKYFAEKKKRKCLENKIQSMRETDWRGEVIKEYTNENGDVLYDMEWAVSVGLARRDLCEEDLKKWKLQKKKRKLIKRKGDDDVDCDLEQ